ncbi:MAG: pseudouridine synthase [Porticoccus sp.]|nr:MAG: pseudouridine synthase [Porticoccus sp.]
MSEVRRQLTIRLFAVEQHLRDLDVWSDSAPSPEALASDQPFAIDTLEFVEWLQFIFLPRMQDLVQRGAPLPAACGIAPMAEEYFRGLSIAREDSIARGQSIEANAEQLIAALTAIDRLLSG